MEESARIALLEKENSELKENVEVLFKTVMQMKSSLNLMIDRYIVGDTNQEQR